MTFTPTQARRIIAPFGDRWDGHTPSPFDWQALLVFRSGKTRIYQFPKRLTEAQAIEAGQQWGKFDKAVAFAVRDTKGVVVHVGPVVDALGGPLEPRWMDAIAEAPVKRRAA